MLGAMQQPKRVISLASVVVLTAAMSAAAVPASASSSAGDAGWVLTTSRFDDQFTAEPFVGNGYVSQRIPAAGMGRSAGQGEAGWPLGDQRSSEALAAGVYANADASTIYPGAAKEVIALIPTWSTLTFRTPSGEYSPATASAATVHDYSQSEDLRTGTVTTSGVWTSPGGQQARFRYQVFTDRARENVGVVSLELTPLWTGPSGVTSLLDGSGAAELDPVGASVDPATHLSYVASQAVGTKQPVAEAAALHDDLDPADPGLRDTAVGLDKPQTAGEQVDFTARAGHTYRFTKYVSVTGAHGPDATTAARAASRLGAGLLGAENAASWADSVWRGDVLVPGQPALQAALRAGTYALYASIRPDSPDAIGPSGLSSNGYAGMVFWDSDIWMFPALLAAHPDIARVAVDYRYNTLAAAEHDAQANGYQGAFYPWTSGDDGRTGADCYGTVTDANDKIISDPNASCSQELHLQADIAISQWQYYEATGDRQWLAGHGWPVLSALAQFWLSKAKPVAGGYAVDTVQPPDEQHTNVDNSAYTNAAAATALRDAAAAATVLGEPVPAAWTTVADGLTATMPFDRQNGIYQEFDGYAGDQVKQADVVMLSYPLNFPLPAGVGLADLDYYAPRTNPDGPAMTDAIHSIDASALNAPGCSAYTYLLRSYEPFLRAPFAQFAETPQDKWTTFNFLTGVGGLLQEFQYGFTGLRFGVDAVGLDPSLPPQLPDLTVTDLHWQGRIFTVAMGRSKTTVTLRSGAALPLDTPAGRLVARPGRPVTIGTRQPDQQPTDDLARCQPVTASSALPGNDAVAAVDGSPATAWTAAQPGGQLTVRLAHQQSVDSVVVNRNGSAAFGYAVSVSTDGRDWQSVATAPSTSSGTDRLGFPPATAQFVRLTFTGTVAPTLTDVTVEAAHP